MIILLLVGLMKKADCDYALSHKWKGFVERHIIADDPYDEQTREHNEKEEDDRHEL